MEKDDIGNRMKEHYENRTRQYLTRRTNTIIRLDGKAFHTYTKACKKPFDEKLMSDMADTTITLCEEIQGAKFGYTQSDEISIFLTDYDKLTTNAWFDGNLQKMCSISASICTQVFNEKRKKRFHHTPAFFDSRVFQIPEKEEVANYFVWRCQDATRNSLQMLCQSRFSHKELQNKNTPAMHEMLHSIGINWNDLEPEKKRGTLITRGEFFAKQQPIPDNHGFQFWFDLVNKVTTPKE
jgi:tRNA(His) guanylyltransferase